MLSVHETRRARSGRSLDLRNLIRLIPFKRRIVIISVTVAALVAPQGRLSLSTEP